MKTNLIRVVIALAMVTSLTANAQPPSMQHPYSGKSPKEVRKVTHTEELTPPIKGLDDKQREEIRMIRTEQLKERTQTRNRLKEKQAQLELLQTSDKPDMKEINRVIDEIATIQAQDMKSQASGRQKIRSILTEEQRVQFDARGKDGKQPRKVRKTRAANGNK